MRKNLQESTAFQRIQQAGATVKTPVADVLTSMPNRVFLLFAVICLPCARSILFIWLPTYLSHMVRPPVEHALLINTLCMAVHVACLPVGGWLSDRFGRKSVFVVSGSGTLILALPLFLWMDQGVVAGAVLSQLMFAVLLGAAWGTLPALMVEMFPTRVRISGIGLGYNSAMALVYGTGPWVVTRLITVTRGDLAAPAYYVMLLAVASLAAVLCLRVRSGQALE